jgi:cobalt-zinc-cadmium resistance protein CzcA
MIKNAIIFSLQNRWVVVGATLIACMVGVWCFLNLKIEAYPDIADTNVIIITKYDGRAAEEVEQQVTIPIERVLNNVPKVLARRSRTIFGLSVVQLNFEDGTDDYFARQQVFQRLQDAELPDGVSPTLAPLTSAVGEIMRYVVEAPPDKYTPMELRTLQDWVILPKLLQTPGIADIATFGGPVKQFQVLTTPVQLRNYGLTLQSVIEAINRNNQNTGGNIIARGGQGFAIRGLGILRSKEDIENIVLTKYRGVPIFIKNVATVEVNPPPPSGILGYNKTQESVVVNAGTEGIVLLRRHENPSEVLKELYKRIEELHSHHLPADVKMRVLYDRSFLINHSLETVGETVLEGITISVVVILLFLGSLRSALVVAVTIPFSLLFAFIMMKLTGIPANLLSLGAIDFGIIVDGAGRMAENMIRHIEIATPEEKREGIISICLHAAQEVGREIFFCVAIIIMAYLPIFTMQRVEGKLFSPMALTLAFALLGSMICALTLIPVLISVVFGPKLKKIEDEHPKHKRSIFSYIQDGYSWVLGRLLRWPKVTLGVVSLVVGLVLFRAFSIGTEFLPALDEGSIFLRCNLPSGVTVQETASLAPKIRSLVGKYYPVDYVITQCGRNDDGTDPFPANRMEILIGLKEYKLWADSISKRKLVRTIQDDLERNLPGTFLSFGQPIIDQVMEIVTGSAADLAISIVGQDLTVMRQKADSIAAIVRSTRGASGVNLEQEGPQAQIAIRFKRDQAARYGINVADVQTMVEGAIGGKAVDVLYEGARRFDIVVRYLPESRNTLEAIEKLQVPSGDGALIPLSQLADVQYVVGQTNIYRFDGERMITVRTNIRDRDQGGFVNEVRDRINRNIHLPEGFQVLYGGQFENLERAGHQLVIAIPLTFVIVLVFLFLLFRNLKDTLIVYLCVPIGLSGGALALIIRGYNFNISSGVGFVSLFGISVMAGIMSVSFLNNALRQLVSDARARGEMKLNVDLVKKTVIEISREQLRPIMMVMVVAMLALIPAATSSGIGSDVQRPLATVIIGGLLATLLFAPFVIPCLYWLIEVRAHEQEDFGQEVHPA